MFSFQQRVKLSTQPGSAQTSCCWHHQTEISRCRSLPSANLWPVPMPCLVLISGQCQSVPGANGPPSRLKRSLGSARSVVPPGETRAEAAGLGAKVTPAGGQRATGRGCLATAESIDLHFVIREVETT